MERLLIDPLKSPRSDCVYSGGISRDLGPFTAQGHPYNIMVDRDLDEEDVGISFTTTETKCERLFEQGLELKLNGDIERSLSCFLDCLEGMQVCQYFAKLAQTLHHLGELCRLLGCHEKAMVYSEMEMLFYEAITPGPNTASNNETDSPHKKTRSKRRLFSKSRPSGHSSAGGGTNPAEYGELIIKKAQEYETLAKSCVKEMNFELALEYFRRATSLKGSVLGFNHPTTVASSKYLATVRSEMGHHESTLHHPERESKVDTDGADSCSGPDNKGVNSPIRTTSTLTNEPNTTLQESTPELPNIQVQATESYKLFTECKQPLTHSLPKQESANLHGYECTNMVQGLANLQVCLVEEHSLNSKLTNDIHWSAVPDNDNGGDCVDVSVVRADLNIEHTRFCPLWVLLLGALLEIVLVLALFT